MLYLILTQSIVTITNIENFKLDLANGTISRSYFAEVRKLGFPWGIYLDGTTSIKLFGYGLYGLALPKRPSQHKADAILEIIKDINKGTFELTRINLFGSQ